METKMTHKGWKYNVLNKEEVINFNSGEVPFMTYFKGKLEWREDKKYLLIPGTGSLILVGDVNQSDEDILNDIAKNSV